MNEARGSRLSMRGGAHAGRFAPANMKLLRTALLACTLSLGLRAADFPVPYNSETDSSSPMPAEDAAAKMTLPPGFKATVYAAEPDVQNPVGMAWDASGRLWIAENYTYAERTKRFDLALRDRVVVFEGEDEKGHFKKRTVFTDSVQMLTSVETGRGGVWLMCPPQLLFIPDANGDLVPDGPAQVMLDGFTVAEANYHNFANGLRWGPDGWLYGRCGHSCPGKIGVPGTPDEKRVPIKGGLWRFHPEKKIFEMLIHGTTNPWGHDWDENGECFFINTVTGHLWHLMPGAHLVDSSAMQIPGIYHALDTIADHYHFDRSKGTKQSAGMAANDLGGGHAHIGMMIYQGSAWPEKYRGELFTVNMHGRRINNDHLERLGCGYVGRHRPDFMLSPDPFFRGIDLSTGPDGNVYVIDWSDIGECHESNGVHRTSGRVFKVSYGKQPQKGLPPATGGIEYRTYSGPPLGAYDSSNEWYVRMERDEMGNLSEAAEMVNELLVKIPAPPTIHVLRALWIAKSAYSKGKLSEAVWRDVLSRALSHDNEHIRVWAIRLLTDFWPLDALVGPMPGAVYPADEETYAAFVRMAREDKSGLVRLVLASVLQRLPVEKREALALALVSHPEDATDRDLPGLIWFGLHPLATQHSKALVRIAAAAGWPDLWQWTSRRLMEIGGKDPELIAAREALLTQGCDPKVSQACREAILAGLAEGLKGVRQTEAPKSWAFFAKSFGAGQRVVIMELSAVFGDGRALDDLKATALDTKAELLARQAALKTLIEHKPPYLSDLCASLLDTRGLAAMAVRGLALSADAAVAHKIAQAYRRLQPSERADAMNTIVTSKALTLAMLENVGDSKGQIPRSEISTFQARQIRSLHSEEIDKKLAEKWGELRAESADKKQAISAWKQKLSPAVLAQANLGSGRALFQVCAACHMLYGEGGKIGPDLTGSGRANIDYLLENIVDPSGVVSAEYRMTIVTLKDGRVLTGMVRGRDERTLTLRQLTEETSLARTDIVKEEQVPVSMMPEGLLQALSETQVRDLLAYLMHPVQVPMPAAAQ